MMILKYTILMFLSYFFGCGGRIIFHLSFCEKKVRLGSLYEGTFYDEPASYIVTQNLEQKFDDVVCYQYEGRMFLIDSSGRALQPRRYVMSYAKELLKNDAECENKGVTKER